MTQTALKANPSHSRIRYQRRQISTPSISGTNAVDVRYQHVDVRYHRRRCQTSTPSTSDIHAVDIKQSCRRYQTSMPSTSDIKAVDIGFRAHRGSRPDTRLVSRGGIRRHPRLRAHRKTEGSDSQERCSQTDQSAGFPRTRAGSGAVDAGMGGHPVEMRTRHQMCNLACSAS